MIHIRFIFPQNYHFESKLFGIIDYSTAVFDVVYGISVFGILNLLIPNFELKLCLFIILVLPILIISFTGFYRESFLSVFLYIFKFIKNRKIYFYEKN